jgi:ribosomal protein S12 methylthiotransferase
MRRIDALEGDFRFRVLYGYPAGVTDEVLEVLNTARHVCKYLDLPVQHSHPDILRAMNRGKAVAATQDLATRLRQAVPGVVLRTTCLVGFPHESEEHFEHLLAYVAQERFDHLGAFAMDGVPAPEVAEERCQRLMALQKTIVQERAKTLKGTADTLLLLRQESAKVWTGRLPRQAPDVDGETRVTGVPRQAKPGDFVRVEITGGKEYDLEAKAI